MQTTEEDLEYARKVILSGKVPFVMTPSIIKKYRRKRVFWVFFWIFAAVLLVLNFFGYLLPAFWVQIVYFAPVFGLLLGLRATIVRSAAADLLVILASIFFYFFVAAFGLTAVNSHLANYLPSNVVRAAESVPQF